MPDVSLPPPKRGAVPPDGVPMPQRLWAILTIALGLTLADALRSALRSRLFWILVSLRIPNMKSVGEDDVAENVMRRIIRDVDRRVHLKIRRDVPGESGGDGVARATLPIELHSPLVVEVIGVAKDRLRL